MRYYKIFTNDSFIGIANSQNCLTYQKQNNLLVITDEDMGQFVEYQGKLYRDTWMKQLPERKYNYIEAIIEEISEEEYNTLAASIEKNEEIFVSIPTVEEEVVIPEANNVSLDFIKESKIKELSYDCNKTIERGVSVFLADENKTSHFSLTTQDQLNLLSAEIALNSGATTVSYRADGDSLYTNYSARDMQQIIDAAKEHKEACLLRYHELKALIEQSSDEVWIGQLQFNI